MLELLLNWGGGGGEKKKTKHEDTMQNMYDVFKKLQLWQKMLIAESYSLQLPSYPHCFVSSEQGIALNALTAI